MRCLLEYLGKGLVQVRDIGTFGVRQFDRKQMVAYHKKKMAAAKNKAEPPEMPKPKRVTKLPCTEEIAKQFEKDENFKIHRYPSSPTIPQEEVKTTKAGVKARPGR